jgi:hypothetical protein
MDWNPYNQFFPHMPTGYAGGASYTYPVGDDGQGITGEEFNGEADEWMDDPYAQPVEPANPSVCLTLTF